jgi:hypothetical protein
LSSLAVRLGAAFVAAALAVTGFMLMPLRADETAPSSSHARSHKGAARPTATRPAAAASATTASASAATTAAVASTAASSSTTTAPLVNYPDDAMANVQTSYGAKGDGVSDDTAAIQSALNDQRLGSDGKQLYADFYGRPKALYFPAGTYRVTSTLTWVGCCVTLRGQGAGHTVIRLDDSAAGFTDAATPKPVLTMPGGNMSFHQNIAELTVNVGSGNPGAVGIDYISNNMGSLSSVSIISEDRQGVAGVSMTRPWPGPCLLRNVTVVGFDRGVQVAQPEYGPTFENLNLQEQRVAGLSNDGNTVAIRGLTSTNTVPAVTTSGTRQSLILLDSVLSGGSASGSAVMSGGGQVYARNVTSSGYASAISQAGTAVAGSSVTEYVAGEVQQLFTGPKQSLNLPISDPPTFQDNDVANWQAVRPKFYGDAAAVQPALDAGKATVYFPHSGYLTYNRTVVTVPASVRKIVGFGSLMTSGPNGGLVFKVAAGSDPLIIEGFQQGITVEHAGARTVSIEHGKYRYEDSASSTDLYLTDVGITPLNITHPHRVWARQLNTEGKESKINNAGGTMWILGLKTEGTTTVITATDQSKTELLGTLLYPARTFTAEEKTKPAFVAVDSDISLIYSLSSYAPGSMYDFQIQQTVNGVTKTVATTDLPDLRMPLFAGGSS